MRKKEIEVYIEEQGFPNKSKILVEGKNMKLKGGIKGQKILARKITRSKAQLIEVLEKSPLEKEENCKYQKVCGGCTYQNFSYKEEIKYKEELLRKLFLENKILKEEDQFILEKSPHYEGYRNKMEYTFGDQEKGGPLALGLHKKNRFHEVVDMERCIIVHQDFDIIRKFVRDFFKKESFFNRKTHQGFLRHLAIRRTRFGEILINLVSSSQGQIEKEKFIKELLNLKLEGKIVGIVHTTNDSFGDAIIGEKVELLYGRPYAIEELCGLKYKIGPFSFFQTNTYSAEILYKMAKDTLGNIEDKKLLDLYSGTGTITTILGKEAKSATGIEIVEEAVKGARENAEDNNLKNIKFYQGDVFQVLKKEKIQADVIVVDPPREGIGKEAVEKISEFQTDQILYISCNPLTLVKDLEDFTNFGYKIKELRALDQFPRTFHVETVVLLERIFIEKHILKGKIVGEY